MIIGCCLCVCVGGGGGVNGVGGLGVVWINEVVSLLLLTLVKWCQ